MTFDELKKMNLPKVEEVEIDVLDPKIELSIEGVNVLVKEKYLHGLKFKRDRVNDIFQQYISVWEDGGIYLHLGDELIDINEDMLDFPDENMNQFEWFAFLHHHEYN